VNRGREPRTRKLGVAAGAGIVLVVAMAVFAWSRRPVDGTAALARHLEDLGRVVVVGGDDLLRIRASGATLVASSEIVGLDAVLDGTDEEALAAVLADHGVAGVVADGRGSGGPTADHARRSLRERLAAYASFEHLQALYLAPTAALYVPRSSLVIRPPYDFALAYVARAILGGARPPRIASFPEPLRRIRNVEVMVMLRDGEQPRLWRSARGSSIARALVTASIVARQRWTERAPAMGGPLDAQLCALHVEVYLLDEDGTFGSRSPAFIERVIGPEHGVAFEHLGTWRYLLPDATRERGQGSAVRAYAELFKDSDMEPDSLTREDVRFYRMLARLLARSPAPAAPRGPASAPAPHAADAASASLGPREVPPALGADALASP
jgi:hypothetical protein